MLAIVQMFDPPGVGARSVSECLLLQLDQLEPATAGLACAKAIARHHLELLAERELTALRRELRTSDEELETAVALVRACHPRPGSIVSGSSPEYVVPDVFVRRTPRGWSVEINAATLPRVRLNQSYASLVGRSTSHASMRAQLQEARWLLKSLEIRNDTLTKVARSIVERQSEFLDQGEEYMRPMILRDIAEAISMHESTVSRVTSGKYMHTPRGVFELRYFFSSQVEGNDGSGTSSTAIRAKIRKLIREEDPAAPLSDSRIAEILSGEGIPVARRTVAKYRETMGLAPSNERRRVNGKVTSTRRSGHAIERHRTSRRDHHGPARLRREKLGRIMRHFDQLIDNHFVLTVEKLQHKAEATLRVRRETIHALAIDGDMYAAIDALADKLERRVRKHKEKLTDHHAQEAQKSARP